MPLLPFSGPVIPTPVPISKGGTGSPTQNFVDLSSTAQIKTGALGLPSINDINGNTILSFNAVASATQYVQLSNSTTASYVGFIAAGAAGNTGLDFSAQGGGIVSFNQAGGGSVQFFNNCFPHSTYNLGISPNHWGTIYVNNIGNSVTPSTNNNLNFGSTSLYWSNLFATTVNLNSTASLSGSTAGQINVTGVLGAPFISSKTGNPYWNLINTNDSTTFGFIVGASYYGAQFAYSTGTGIPSTGTRLYIGRAGTPGSNPTTVIGTSTTIAINSIANLQTILDDGSGNMTVGGNFTVTDAKNIILGTTTGTQIGTVGGASGQKLAFFGSTPVTQPLLATGASHTVDDVITTLQTLGLVRQS
jgi:hypothetical protein